jgi:hypothetical protein
MFTSEKLPVTAYNQDGITIAIAYKKLPIYIMQCHL